MAMSMTVYDTMKSEENCNYKDDLRMAERTRWMWGFDDGMTRFYRRLLSQDTTRSTASSNTYAAMRLSLPGLAFRPYQDGNGAAC